MKSPKVRLRPKLAQWMFERQLDTRDGAAALQCSYETVRLICLPFDDANRRLPSDALAARIEVWTDGAVRLPDFYPERSPALAGAAEPCGVSE